MRLHPSIPIAAVALLSGSVAGHGLFRSDLNIKLQVSAELGLNARLLLHDRQAFRAASTQADIEPETVELPIDHDDPSVGTYQNRFWVNEAYYRPGGPVVLYDAGETSGEWSATLLTSNSSLKSLLQEVNAIGIVWEHRYYGASLPYPVTTDTPPDHFKYLNTRQALADIPYFAENFTRSAFPDTDLTPESTPWVMVGCSYPGIRAALARNEYPDTIFASYAAGAPVQAQIDMSWYYEQIYRAMVANGYGNCAKDIHAAHEYIDEQLANEDTASAIKQLFFGPGAEQNSNEDFTATLSGIFGYFQVYGFGGPQASLGEFCTYLEKDPVTGLTAGPEGLAPVLGSQHLAERWAAWDPFLEVVNLNMETNCRGLNKSMPPSCELNKPLTSQTGIAWSWQYCSEWGFYQSNNVGNHSLLSRYQTLEFQQAQCNRMFPEAVERGLLPPQPQSGALNKEFGGWTIRPTNVYWTTGEFDPWRSLGMLSTEDFAPQHTVTTEVPQCGVKTDKGTVFGYIGKNQYHCFDFGAGSEVGAGAQSYFVQALKEWLPCFKKQK
ncbi:serine carboxypeptidase S28-domain-containing protein [Aspergillus egyptiacus]|nr:serine carboxypeptidase S28-domain-containing protein [Aspergillus egyptiacus]